jgi:hypothetical protein
LDFVHGVTEILGRPGPARRIDARIAAECIDSKAGVVGEARLAARLRRGFRLDPRVGPECVAGLIRLDKLELTR